jgi:hypothetical protein
LTLGQWWRTARDWFAAAIIVGMGTRDEGRRDWLLLQQTAFEALAGQTVTCWEGVEMALRDTTPSGPQFIDAEVPLLQLVRVDLTIDAHHRCTIHTYQDDSQDDTAWGLQLAPDKPRADPRDWDGIYRQRSLELPVGRIDGVDVRIDEDTLAEVTLRFAEAELLLIAGEVWENFDGTLDFHRFDESVLAFTEPAAASALVWIPPRSS